METKYQIYQACIISKLIYRVQASYLTKNQSSKLNRFHARCIRRITGIKYAYYSRVSNAEVLEKIGARQLSNFYELLLFGNIYRWPENDEIWQRRLWSAHLGVGYACLFDNEGPSSERACDPAVTQDLCPKPVQRTMLQIGLWSTLRGKYNTSTFVI